MPRISHIAHLLVIFSPNTLLHSSHHIHQVSCSRKESLSMLQAQHSHQSGRLCLSRVPQSIYSGNKCHPQEIGSSAHCSVSTFVIPVCINWPSVGHHPISARCTNVSALSSHITQSQFMVFVIVMGECCSQSSVNTCMCHKSFYLTGVQTAERPVLILMWLNSGLTE